MTLQVPYDKFAETVRRVLAVKEAYVCVRGTTSLVTASSATARVVVASLSAKPVEAIKTELDSEGIKLYDGAWSAEGLTDFGDNQPAEAHVAAVAYMSDDGRPGLWVDAYDALPSPSQVLKTMFDEFRSTGEAADVSFEEFVRLANANVIVVTPTQLRGFVQEKVSKVLPD